MYILSRFDDHSTAHTAIACTHLRVPPPISSDVLGQQLGSRSSQRRRGAPSDLVSLGRTRSSGDFLESILSRPAICARGEDGGRGARSPSADLDRGTAKWTWDWAAHESLAPSIHTSAKVYHHRSSMQPFGLLANQAGAVSAGKECILSGSALCSDFCSCPFQKHFMARCSMVFFFLLLALQVAYIQVSITLFGP